MTCFLILAGGDGSRLVGKEYPKSLMRLVVRPVIELLIDRIQASDRAARMIVVTKEKWRHDFQRWLDRYPDRQSEPGVASLLPSGQRIELLFEEEELPQRGEAHVPGTLQAICLTLARLERESLIREGDVFQVMNGDVYVDDSFGEEESSPPGIATFWEESQRLLESDPDCSCVIGAYRLRDFRDAKGYGVIRHLVDSDRVDELIEKPDLPYPGDNLVSAGFYALRYDREMYNSALQHCANKAAASSRSGASEKGAAVNLGSWIQNRVQQGRRTQFREIGGAWFDVGTPSTLADATRHYIVHNIDAVRRIGDLAGRRHASTCDRFFVFARPSGLSFQHHPRAGMTLALRLYSGDPIVTRKPNQATSGWINLLSDLVAARHEERVDISQKLANWLVGAENPAAIPRLYLSGGVLLVDSKDDPTALSRRRSRVPLQRRDFGASLDPDRLTMPAGGLGTLSLTECCYAEMQEEMICYGDALRGGARVLFYLRPPCQALSQGAFLRHIVEKRLRIPGIDPVSIDQAQYDEAVMNALVAPLPVAELNLQHYRREPHIWEVSLLLDEEEIDRGWFFVTVDRQTHTLECRKVAVANISNVGANPGGRRPNRLYGQLAGIADGEGHGRLPVLVGADALIAYSERLNRLDREGLLEHICAGPDDLIDILCSGEPGSGRLNWFDFRIPVATTTKTFGDMLPFLARIFGDG